MTVTLDRPPHGAPAKRPGRKRGTATVPGLAQVNLLPPEIRARRAVKRLSRWLVAGLSLLAVALVGGYVAADREVATAHEELASAQTETARLTREQLTYADVPSVLGQVSRLQEARAQGFSTEVSWAPRLGAVLAVLPEGAELTSVDLTGATPMVAPAPPADPLQAPSLSRLTFTARTASLPDTAAWVVALDAVPGFSDAWVSSATLGSDEEGDVHYDVTATVQVTDRALTHRFDVREDS